MPQGEHYIVRFRRFVDDSGGDNSCWPWLGATDQKSRGQFYKDGRKHRAPRIAWEIENGETIPPHLDACHSCDNPNCVNPAHIWPGTRRQNCIDAVLKGRLLTPTSRGFPSWQVNKTHCKNGHEFNVENTYFHPSGKRRQCKICRRISVAKHDMKRRSVAIGASL